MLTYRVYYGSIEIEPLAQAPLLPTREDAVTNGFELLKLLLDKFSKGEDLLFKLPDRQNSAGKVEKRAVFSPRIKDYPTSGVIIFDFWKINYDLDDRKIFDEAARRVDHLKDLLTLADTQGALIEGHCAYDYSSRTLIWRDVNGLSKTNLEFFFKSILGRNVKINHLADSHADEDFAKMDLESLSLDVETRNIDGIAKIVSDSAIGRASVSASIADIAQETEAGRVKITILANKRDMRDGLKKDLLNQDVGVLQKILALANIGRSQNNRVGRLRAEGRIDNPGSAGGNYDSRVIDLFKGLLIRKQFIAESSDAAEQEKIIDEAMIRFAQMGRESQDGIQTASTS